MSVTPVRSATPADAAELLRLRVDVLTGEPATDAWRSTFPADMQARLGADPHLLAFVADGGNGRLRPRSPLPDAAPTPCSGRHRPVGGSGRGGVNWHRREYATRLLGPPATDPAERSGR